MPRRALAASPKSRWEPSIQLLTPRPLFRGPVLRHACRICSSCREPTHLPTLNFILIYGKRVCWNERTNRTCFFCLLKFPSQSFCHTQGKSFTDPHYPPPFFSACLPGCLGLGRKDRCLVIMLKSALCSQFVSQPKKGCKLLLLFHTCILDFTFIYVLPTRRSEAKRQCHFFSKSHVAFFIHSNSPSSRHLSPHLLPDQTHLWIHRHQDGLRDPLAGSGVPGGIV